MSFIEALQTLGREATRMVLSSLCVVCGEELSWKGRTASCCGPCWSALPRIRGAKCSRCSLPWSGPAGEFTCGECGVEPPPVDFIEAWGHYRGGLDRVIRAFKFEGQHFYAGALARLAAETLQDRGDLGFDLLAHVPMHRSRRRQRGYDQAELLGRELAPLLGLPFDSELLVKVRANEAQSTLPREARRRNVRGVYVASPSAKGKRVLLVDDVCTTGETLGAAARALKKQKSFRIAAVVVARA